MITVFLLLTLDDIRTLNDHAFIPGSIHFATISSYPDPSSKGHCVYGSNKPW